MPKVQIILGSTREGRAGGKVADWFLAYAKANAGFDVELIDLRDWPLPHFNDPVSPAKAQYSYDYTQKWSAKISEAQGYIIITPEYNHGYPGVLKNALDHLYREWNGKPVGFVSYGGAAAGSRAVEQLRQVVVELQMKPLREQVLIPMVWDGFDESGQLKDRARFEVMAQKLLDQMAKAL